MKGQWRIAPLSAPVLWLFAKSLSSGIESRSTRRNESPQAFVGAIFSRRLRPVQAARARVSGENEGKLGSRSGIICCLIALGVFLSLAFSTVPAAAQDFVPHGSIKLEYEEDHEKTGSVKTERSTITQDYEITFDGYIWRHDFLTFQSSFTYGDTMDDDSESGESRDRDVDLYDITADILPDWPTPMLVEARKNIIILNSDDSLDTRSEEDTYRFEWQALYAKLPQLNFEFERIDEEGKEIGADLVTSKTQRDSYNFTATDTIFGRAQLQFEYDRDEDRDELAGTEDVSEAYLVTAEIEPSSNLRVDITLEYRTNDQESSTVINSVALREDVDSIVAFSFFDANQPALNSIGDHMAIPLTSGGAPDFIGAWPPEIIGSPITIDDVNNNEVTFSDAIPSDEMVVIEYQTQDGTRYFDIYRGDNNADTFLLTVTQVVISEGFDDFLVFAEYISIGGGLVTLDFAPLASPEPIDSTQFSAAIPPLQNVDVSIEYNTRSRRHFVDDFPNVDIEQSGTEFDLTRISSGQDEERLFDIEISYLPTAELDLNFRYEFNETENETEIVTEHSWEATMKYFFTDRLTSTTDLSYDREETDLKFNPDVDDPDLANQETPTSEEWNYRTQLEYSRPLGWAVLDASYEYEFDTREDEGVSKTDSTTHLVELDLTAGRTKGTASLEYDRQEDEDFETGETKWATEFGFEVSVENKQPFGALTFTTTLEYEYELDEEKDADDFTKNTYSIDEDVDYKNISLTTSAQYQDEESGESWSKELDLEAEVDYAPFGWLDISAGTNWTNTKTEQEDSTQTDAFIEGDVGFDIGPSASIEFGVRREWLWDDPGEDEKSFEFDAKFSYIYAAVTATLELDYDRTEFNGDSEDTENYGFTVTVERDF